MSLRHVAMRMMEKSAFGVQGYRANAEGRWDEVGIAYRCGAVGSCGHINIRCSCQWC